MLENVLPTEIALALSKLDFKGLQELRLRANKPITICYFSKYYFLNENGLSSHCKKSLILSSSDLDDIIFRASNFSLYAVNEEIKQGFISLKNGIRIGIVGQVVMENNKIITIKNFSALNFRFPHEIKGASDRIIDKLIDNDNFLNTLVVSSPGAGKTTLIRDIARQISGIKLIKNILIVDERNEISGFVNGTSTLDIGLFSDILVGGEKAYAFSNGIRSMSPDVIVTDEIGSKQDCECLQYASTCGVSILATIHAKNINQLLKKVDFLPLLTNKIFKRYVVLSSKNGKGTIENLYDENLKEIHFN